MTDPVALGDSAEFQELARLDKLIHEPARLALLSALAVADRADFTYLQRVTGLSKGNLSAHLTTLETAGIVEVEKGYTGRRPKTWVRITVSGHQAVEAYWETMMRWNTALRAGDRASRPDST